MSPLTQDRSSWPSTRNTLCLIHFPIALCMIGVAFDFVALRTKNTALASAAYYNLVVAAAATLPVCSPAFSLGDSPWKAPH